jgi:predicted transcriptional regulator
MRSIARPSITFVLKWVSDDKTLDLFNSIARDNNNGIVISLKEMNLTTKEYYSRISGLVKAGLIKRNKGKYFPTLLGKVVYDSQLIIGEALSQYWKLKAIDSIDMTGPDLSEEEITQLMNALIDNHQIKDILMKPTFVSSIGTESMIQVSTPTMAETQSVKE